MVAFFLFCFDAALNFVLYFFRAYVYMLIFNYFLRHPFELPQATYAQSFVVIFAFALLISPTEWGLGKMIAIYGKDESGFAEKLSIKIFLRIFEMISLTCVLVFSHVYAAILL